MIDDELMNKFDSIEDLPISEEMLGAYLEGNLTDAESIIVNNAIDSFHEVSSLVTEVPIFENHEPFELIDDGFSVEMEYTVEDVELPIIPSLELNEAHSFFTDDFVEQPSFHDIGIDDNINNFDSSSFDTNMDDPENYLSQDDSFGESHNSLESNDNSDSISDEDMFNPNLDF